MKPLNLSGFLRSGAAVITLVCGGMAQADNSWDGGGTSPFNWSDNTNWGGDTVPGYGTLTFSGSLGTTNTVDANYNMNELLWTGSSAWILNNSGGSIISLYDNSGVQAKVENQSGGLVTINAPIDFAATAGAAWAEINAVNGDITFGTAGTISVSGSAVNELRFYGSGHTVTINSVLTAGTKKLVIGPSVTDNNTVVLNGANSYSGNTEVNVGAVQVGNNSGLGTGIAYLGNGGSTFANLNSSLLLNAGGLTVSNTIVTNKADTGSGLGSGIRTIGGNFTSGTSTYSGNIYLNGGAVLTAGSGGTAMFSGVIQNGTDTGNVSRALNVNAPGGTVVLTNANTYTGGTTINAGTLQVGNGGTTGSLGTGNIVDNGTLAYSRSNASGISLPSGTGISGTGNLTATARDIAFTGNITLGGSQSYTETGGGSLYQGLEVAANTTLTGSSITLSGDVGKRGSTGNTLTLDTSAANGTVNLNISIGRGSVWYPLSGMTVNAGTGTINITGTGPASSGWNSSVTLNGALNITGNIPNVQSSVFHATANSTISGSLGMNNGLNGYTPLNVDGGATLTVSAALSGVSGVSWGGFQKQGAGVMDLQVANTGMGQGAQITGGTIKFVHNALYTPNTANGSRGYAIDFQGNATIQWATGNTDDVTAGSSPAGSNMRIGDGITATLDTNGNNVTLGSAIVVGSLKTGGLTKTGSGTLTLTAANTYTGNTGISNGTLLLNAGSLSASGTVSITSGAIFGGKGSAGAVSVASGGIMQGGIADVGSLALTSLAFSGSGTLNLMPVSGTTASIAVSGAATTSGTETINITSSGPLVPGLYKLVSYGSLGGAGITAFSLGTYPATPGGVRPRSYALDTTTAPASYVGLNVIGDAPVWTGNNNGAWDTTTTNNWVLLSDGATATTCYNADAVQFNNATGNRSVTINGSDVSPASVVFNNGAGYDYTLGGTKGIIGSASLTKSGAGTLTISNSNTYVGGTTLNAGTLVFGGTSAIGTGVLTIAGGSLDSSVAGLVNAGNNAQNWNGNINFVGSNALNLGTGAVTLNATRTVTVAAQTLTVGGVISGSGFGLTKDGPGTLALTGASNYTGTTTITAGTLNVGNGGATGALGTGAIVNNSTLIYNLVGTSTTASLPAAGITGTGVLTVTADTLNLNGNVTTSGHQSYAATSGGSNNHGLRVLAAPVTLTATGGASISMTGDAGYTNTGPGGALVLDTSSGNGTVTLNVSNGRNNSLYPINSITVNAGTGIINVAGTGPASAGWYNPVTLTGAVNITGNVAASNGTVTINSNGTTTGIVSGAFSGNMLLTKSGSGTLTMSGANTYTGATAASGGSLLLNGGSLSASSAISVAGTATFGGKGSAGAVTVIAGGAIQGGYADVGSLGLTSMSFAGSGTLNLMPVSGTTASIAVSGALTTSGTETLNITSGNPLGVGSYRLVSWGSIAGSGSSAFALGSLPASGSVRPRTYVLDTTPATYVGLNVTVDAPIWTGNTNGVWDTTTTNNWKLASDNTTPTLYYNADAVQFNDTAGNRNLTIAGANVTPASVTFNNSAGNDYSLSGSYGIAGTASLAKSGAGTLTIGNSNSYGGGTTLTAGTLVFGGTSAIGTGVLTINGGTLDSSVANLVNAGNNAQNWNADFTFAGSNSLNLGTGAVTMNASRTVTVTANTLIVGGGISGSGFGLTKTGAGTLVLYPGNTFTGGLTVQQGTVDARGAWASNTALGIGPVTIGSGATVTKSDNDFQEVRGDLTLNGGTLAATGIPNSNYGNFFVDYRVITTGDVQSVISAQVNMRGTHEFNVADGAADIDLLVTGHLGNEEGYNWGSVNKTGAGTMELTNATNSIGSLTISAGKVILQGIAGSYGNGGIIDNSVLEINIASGGGTFSPVISGSGTLTKTGGGTLTLGAANTYTGATTVNAGALSVNGSTAIASSVSVNNAGTKLMGTGTVGGNTTLNSGTILAPGNSIGKETFSGNLTLNSGSIFEWELAATPAETGRGTSYDAVNVAGTLAGSGAVFRVVLNGAQDFSESFWDTAHSWSDIFMTSDSGTNVSFASLFSSVQYYNSNGNLGNPAGQGYFTISGNTLSWTAVPEPTGTLAGFLLGAALLRRRRGGRE